ncbi:MAG: hypothetical protein KJO62_09805, partial [Gammaproteobacteria bacterium]|nr:hypothetical protein [Gammaproteobacteria bacterium]
GMIARINFCLCGQAMCGSNVDDVEYNSGFSKAVNTRSVQLKAVRARLEIFGLKVEVAGFCV